MAAATMCVKVYRIANYVTFANIPRIPATRWSRRWMTSSTTNPDSKISDDGIDASKNVEKPLSTEAENPAGAAAVINEFTKEKESLLEKIGELDDKYKRALAETENVRQRMQRQIQDAKLFGIQGFCKDLLDVADVLQRATTSVPSEELTSKNPHLKNLFDGLQMTETQLQKVFRTHGLLQINPVGEKFNPNLHEALFEQVVEGKEPGTVAMVTKIGYKLHERTIRPALVGVVKAAPT